MPQHIDRSSKIVLFADNTSILIMEKNHEKLNQKIRLTLDCSDRWFKANQLVLNLMKTNIIKFCPSYSPQPQLITEHNNTTVSAVPNARFLGV